MFFSRASCRAGRRPAAGHAAAVLSAACLSCRVSTEARADDEAPPDHWHYGYRWYNGEPRTDPAGASSSAAVWQSGLRAPRWPGPAPRTGERLFARAEVAVFDGSGPDGRILVTYRDGVYDVTEYVKEHPGRHFILTAAGGPIDPWWSYWAAHHVCPAAAAALEKLRVGRLQDADVGGEEVDEGRTGGGLWAEEQELDSRAANRRSCWRIAEMPYQSVTKCAALVQAYLTPRDALYVRNHAPVPAVAPEEADEHTLTFCVGEDELTTWSLAEMKRRFCAVRITSVLQCTGNRAADNLASNGVKGSGFAGSDDEFIGLGMLGNATWGGWRLADLLREVVPEGIRAEWCSKDLHVTFEGLDGYYTSIPLAHVMDGSKDCLLATEMNGDVLSPDHGFPVRVVLPGVAGARQVKWITKITVGALSNDPWTRHFYRDKPSTTPIYDLPMNCAILSPEPGTRLSAGETTVEVRGFAFGGGTGREIAQVEVSTDRGQTWKEAKLLDHEIQRSDAVGVYRGWVRFEVSVGLPAAQGLGCGGPLTEFWCRSRCDGAGWQPERSEQHGGYLYSGYHKVPVVRA